MREDNRGCRRFAGGGTHPFFSFLVQSSILHTKLPWPITLSGQVRPVKTSGLTKVVWCPSSAWPQPPPRWLRALTKIFYKAVNFVGRHHRFQLNVLLSVFPRGVESKSSATARFFRSTISRAPSSSSNEGSTIARKVSKMNCESTTARVVE